MAASNVSGAETSGLVHTLQGHVDEIRTLIQCGICIRPLYEPFTLACGHTFCYSCLTSWFSGGRSKRTCPDCRAPVKTQPAPAYLVRAMVQMFTSRAELLDQGETTKEHIKNQKEEAGRLELDKGNNHPTQGGLFGGLFKPKEAPLAPVHDVDDGVMRCPHCAWELEEGHCEGCGYQYRPGTEGTDDSESEDYSESDADSFDGLDEEEPIEGAFDDMAEEAPYESYFGDIGQRGQAQAWNDFALNRSRMQAHANPLHYSGLLPVGGQMFLDRLATHHMVPHNHTFFRRDPNAHPGDDPYADEEEEEDEEDEENEYDEADSFIDDEHNGLPTSSFVGSGHHDTSGEVYDIDSESDRSTGTVVDDIHGDPPSTDGLLQWRDTTPYIDEDSNEEADMEGVVPGTDDSVEEDDDDDDDDEDEDIRAVPPRRRHPHFAPQHQVFQAPSEASWLTSRAAVIHDSDDEPEESSEESESESSPPPRRPAGRPTSAGNDARNAIALDDSDDDEDDRPVGPVRRNTHRRNNRFSPY